MAVDAVRRPVMTNGCGCCEAPEVSGSMLMLLYEDDLVLLATKSSDHKTALRS